MYKTTNSNEVVCGYNDHYYDDLYIDGLTVVKYWDPPTNPLNSFLDVFTDYGDGFTVTIQWIFSIGGSLLAPLIQLRTS